MMMRVVTRAAITMAAKVSITDRVTTFTSVCDLAAETAYNYEEWLE